MSILKSGLLKALLIPLALALSLAACSTQAQPGAVAPVSGVAAADSSGGSVPAVTTLAVKKYKMSTVKKHHTKTNCWTVIGKNVYKLTKFVKKHPGGSKRIIALCGKNGTNAFRGQHGTGGKANSVLKKYKIGVLA